MRSGLAVVLCVLAFIAGCASTPPSAPKDPRLLAREAYLNALAERCEKDAALLREQACAMELKAREKDVKAQQLRKNARLAAQGEVVVDPEEPEH